MQLENSVELSHQPDKLALGIISEQLAKRYGLLPLKVNYDKLWIALDTSKEQACIDFLDFLQQTQQKKIVRIHTPALILSSMISEHYHFLKNARETSIVHGKSHWPTPTETLLEETLFEAARQGCSDVHIEPLKNCLRIRYRKDGQLQEIHRLDLSYHKPLSSYLKLRAHLNIAEKRLPQEGQINFKWTGKTLHCRLSCLPTIQGDSFAIRLLSKTDVHGSKLPALNLENSPLLSSFKNTKEGLWLISGPTGSGKTTTFYALLQALFRQEKRILTVEDPLEVQFENFVQIQMGHTLSFENALRAFLRQSADVIGIGEIRDKKTLDLALNSVLAGHCVVATIHAKDAVGTLERLRKMGAPINLMATVLKGIFSQRLIKCLCACAEHYPASLAEKTLLGVPPNESLPLKKQVGCSQCNYKGISHRRAIFEWLNVDKPVQDIIECYKSEKQVREFLKQSHWPDLFAFLTCLIRQQKVSLAEAERFLISNPPHELRY